MQKKRRKYFVVIGLVLLTGFSTSILLYRFLNKTETIRTQSIFNRNCEAIRVSIQRELERSSDVLNSIKANYISHKGMTREEYRIAIKYSLKNIRTINAIGWIPIVSLAKRDTLEQKARLDGFTDFQFTELENDKLIPAKKRETYYPLYYLEPYENNRLALGYDLASNNARKVALEKSASTGEITATEPIILVQEIGDNTDNKSFLIFLPIYEDELGLSSEHKASMFLSAGINIYKLINEATSLVDVSNNIALEIIDPNSKKEKILFSNKQRDVSYSFSKNSTLHVANRSWQLQFKAPPIISDLELSLQTNIIPLVVILITVLVSMLLSKILTDNSKELEEINNQLKETSERFIKIFDKNPVGLVISNMETSKLEYVNESFLTIFGYTSKEVIGKTNDELKIVSERFRDKVLSLVRQKGYIKNIEVEAKRKNGENIWVLYSSEIIEIKEKKFILSSIYDMHERKALEEQISRLAEFQKIILNGTDYAIITTSHPEGIITSFNRGAEKMLGYKAEELISITSPAIIHDATEVEKRAKILTQELQIKVEPGIDVFHVKSRLGFENDVNEWTYICKDGSRISVELSITTLRNKQKEIVGYLGIAKDITDNKKAKEAIIKAKEAAEQANQLKETFLANMSHEIRTPMNAIIGFTDLLLKKDLKDQERDYIRTIKTSGENLLRIINDILDVSKIDSGMMTFEDQPISIKEIFSSINVMLSQKANEKDLNLTFNYDANLPDTVLGDPTRLTQIIINLVGNAIKFTKKGSVDVFAKTIRSENDNYYIEFSIKDTGIGIAEDKLEHIFGRFIQAESNTTRNYGGTGLGLNIAKQLVELQGGTINIQSKLNVGTVFSFILPFKKTNRTLPVVSNHHDTINLEELSQLNVLLVEDNSINIKFVMSLFADYNMRADIAENGQLAVEKLKNKHYDLVLMDIEMPLMNGYEATIVIRNTLKSTIPIIAMTAHAMSGEKEKCLQIGMNDYISKPINADLLLEKIYTETKSKTKKNKVINQKNKVIDLDFLIKSMRGKKEVILEIMNIFLKEVPEDLLAINAAINKVDYPVIKTRTHKLVSSVTVMGMHDLEHILNEMETLGKSAKEIEKIKQLNQVLNAKCEQALEEVKIEQLNYL